jgi:hypothetical protein
MGAVSWNGVVETLHALLATKATAHEPFAQSVHVYKLPISSSFKHGSLARFAAN